MTIGKKFSKLISGLALFSLLTTGLTPAHAQEAIVAGGDAVVSGFSGIKPSDKPMPPAANPLDHFFINLDGPAAQIFSLNGFGQPPNGQLVTPTVKRLIKASEVGQVFAIALDDGRGTKAPNIYLGATSAYGIHIVGPDLDGNGTPDRIKKGKPGAKWMAGQFGPAPEGNPGTIWRVDGKSGEVTAFATLPGNSGPGIGDIAFDKRSGNIYASDLDTGRIHRVGADGLLIDSFDHGQDGRPAKGLGAVADDGKVMNIEDPNFDSLDPGTWGFTQKQRMVYGMAINDGRLYYAVHGGLQVWSIGLSDDGSFAGDARWEIDVAGLPGIGPITDILFDGSGRMYLAQRGNQKASYNYSEFADPAASHVVRYALEKPDNAATESRWMPDPESYAIAMPAPNQGANGGIALGFGYNGEGNIDFGKADTTLWTTGERLRSSSDDGAAPAAENDVHGLQGNDVTLARPKNVPPQQSYFADYDSLFSDPEKAGHMGDVEIWQPAGQSTYVPPFITLPPETEFPPYIPPEIIPDTELNLKLTKKTTQKECWDGGAFWQCNYKIRVKNTSNAYTFDGTIHIKDTLVNVPPGTLVSVPQHPAPWLCAWITAPEEFQCARSAVLPPLTSVAMDVFVRVPKPYDPCFLTNIAEITAPPGGTWQNVDPADDVDSATALIPHENCPPPGGPTNLRLEKDADPEECLEGGDGFSCRYRVTVTNMGPGVYNGPVQVQDDPAAGTTAVFSWPCVAAGAGYSCNHPAVNLFPGQQLFMWAWVDVPFNVGQELCEIENKASITFAPGGSPQNFNPADDSDTAVAIIPGTFCQSQLKSKIECPPGFRVDGATCVPRTGPPVVPPPPVKSCPPGMTGKWPDCRKREVEGPSCRPGWTYFKYRSSIPAGWQRERRTRNGKRIWCAKEVYRPGPECRAGWTPFQTRSSIPSGWQRERRTRNGKHIWCGKEVYRPGPECRVGWKSFSSRYDVPKNWRSYKASRNGKSIWCGRPKREVCPPNTDGRWPNCTPKVCKYPLVGKWPNCTPGGNVGPQCRPGWTKYTSKSAVPRGWKSYTVNKNGIRIWCAQSKYGFGPSCRKGWTKFTSKSSVPSGWQSYTTKLEGIRIWCGKRGHQSCEQIGKLGKWPKCFNPPVKVCKYPQIGKWPNCFTPPKKTCAQLGKLGKYPRCYDKPKKTCAQLGKLGKYPRCYDKPKKNCAQIGKLGKWPRCYNKPKKTCAQIGKLGKWPKCFNRPIKHKPVKKPNWNKVKKQNVKKFQNQNLNKFKKFKKSN